MILLASLALHFAEEAARPELFAPGAISTGEYESHPCFSADGRTLWYSKSTPQFDSWTIVRARLEGEAWSAPVVPEFSGRWSDADPCLTPDGARLWFISNRPRDGSTAPADLDLWFVERTGEGWGEPKNPGPPINSKGNEWFPSLTREGTLYFGSDRAGGKGATDIWRARFVDGGWLEPENLGDAINTRFDEYEACVAPDESFLVLMTTRPDPRAGNGDLYVSRRRDGAWSAVESLGGDVNTPGFEVGPHLAPDGRWLYFASTRPIAPRDERVDYAELSRRLNAPGNGLGDIYRVELVRLGLP